MGWFNKKEEQFPSREVPTLPQLPELPELPELHEHSTSDDKDFIHKLPKFPTSPFGEKFSQNTIKQAVKGFPSPSEYLSGDNKGDRVFEAD